MRLYDKQPLYVIATQYRTSNGQKQTARTIRSYLYANGVRSYVAAAKPYLSANHVAASLK